MKLGALIGVLAILLFNPIPASYADECGRGMVETWTKGVETPSTEIIPLCQDSIHYQAWVDGVIVGEATFQVEEMDVIIQIVGDPLSRVKGPKKSMLTAAADLERMRNQVKNEILRLDNEIRGRKRLPLKTLGEGIKREYHHVFNGLATRINREALKDIEKVPGVIKVWRDQKVQAYLSESVPLIRADRVWAEQGISGQGIVVAVIDTGIDYTHPDLGGCLGAGCKVIRGYDFVNHDPNPFDDHGHGTHVAGIVAANGTLKGVAPGAKLMAVKVLDQYGMGSFSNVIAGIEWAVDPDGNPGTDDGAQVINLSLGGPGDPDDPVSQAVDNAVAAGVVVVVAAGNSGPGYETLGSPGVARNALTVGASDKKDQIAAFSS